MTFTSSLLFVIVNVKWNGTDYELEADTDDSVELLKTQLYTMTSVQPDRQKLLFKGKTLTVIYILFINQAFFFI